MHRTSVCLGVLCLSLACIVAHAQERSSTPVTSQPASLQLVQEQKGGKGKKDDKTVPPKIDLTEAPPITAEATPAPSFNMIGDQGFYSLVFVQVPSLAKIDFGDGQIVDIPFNGRRGVRVPIPGRGGIKIAENENVLPQDRAFLTYNYYDNVRGPSKAAHPSQILSETVTFQGQEVNANIFIPGVTLPRANLHRETFGFEKTFFDGNASFGMRVPFFQQGGAAEFSDSDVGDMTFIIKYAQFIERQSGSGISAGLAVTVPTGPTIRTEHGEIDSTILQPFLGYQLDMDRLLVYGFFSVAIPSDVQDVTLMFNDVGIGYRVFDGRGGLINSIIPALEAHVTTPMNHRSANSAIQGIDLVVLTGGVHFGLGERSLLTLGVATPITGPRVFDVEAIVQLNFRF